MGVIYKILKQQRSMDLSLSSATRCKVQAAIKQRQQQRRLEDHLVREQEQDQDPDPDHIAKDKEELAEQQLQQLCRFLAENAARKKRQRFKLQYQCDLAADRDQDQDQEPEKEHFPPPPHEMDLEFIEQLHHQSSSATSTSSSGPAPRDSILQKIRHQIFERKRQRQRQLAELVQQRLVVWRPW